MSISIAYLHMNMYMYTFIREYTCEYTYICIYTCLSISIVKEFCEVMFFAQLLHVFTARTGTQCSQQGSNSTNSAGAPPTVQY